jgi:peptidoglycan/xylan/chitin deacetylase (PgdA/CDA1 family)
MSKRRRIAHLLHQTGALAAILKARARCSPPWLNILTYHRFPDPRGEEPFDDGVIDVTLGEFERHVICLKRHFTPVGVDELCAFARGDELPPNPVVITFDDGYLSGYEQALPILQRHRCKAIFFVATSFITERRLYWWDHVAYLMKRSRRDVVDLEYPSAMRLDMSGDRSAAIKRVLDLIKVHPTLQVDGFLRELSRATEVPWTPEMERAFAERMLLTWDHVRALRKAGMDVQSHTRTHRVLQTLSPGELDDELSGSRADLERELDEPVRAVAYPVGRPLESDSPIRTALKKAGYEIGFTNGTGSTSTLGRVDPFDISRHTVDRSFSEPDLLGILAVPFLARKHPWHSRLQ